MRNVIFFGSEALASPCVIVKIITFNGTKVPFPKSLILMKSELLFCANVFFEREDVFVENL